MHYTGMAAASFIPAWPPDLSRAVSISPLANNGIAIVTVLVIVAAITTSSVDRRRNQERLHLVIDTIPQQIWSSPPDGSLDFCNAQFRSYVGRTLEELQGEGWQQMLHPDDRERVVKRWRESVMNGTPFEQEVRHRAADGQYRWFLVRSVPLRDPSGCIVRWYGTSTDIEDRKQAEEELKGSEERHRVIVEAASDVVISMDENGGILLANPATARIFGYDPAELIGKPLTVLMPEFMRKLHEAGFRRYLATGKRHLNWQGTEVTALRKSGQEFPVEVSFGEMISNGHKVFTGFVRDISEKKRAEDELRRQKEVFQKIFENIPVMIAFRGQDRRLEMVNPEWERAMGWTLKEIRGQNLDIYASFFPDPDYRQIVLDLLAASTGESNDLKVSVKDGRIIDVASTFVRLSDGSTLGIGRDITERKRAEDALRESEERFRTIFENAGVGAAVLDWQGHPVKCNPTLQRMLGFTEDELHNKAFTEFTHPDDIDCDWKLYAEVLAGKRDKYEIEKRYITKDGRVVWGNLIVSLMKNKDGTPANYMVGMVEDITERKRAEEQLHQAQEDLARVSRVVAMGELAATIAHEVNQPIAAIVTNANFCLRQFANGTGNSDKLREAISEIVHDGTRASAVISRIRALLRKGVPERAELDINQTIGEVTTLLRDELNRVSFHADLAPDLPRVFGDRVQLQQVLINLVMNGIEAMRSITGRPRDLLIKSAKIHDDVSITVQDSGTGLDPEQVEHVFEPFFTTKPEGIGMGLSISRSIVESHGGRLWAESGPRGALFQFTLPAQ
jgi:PAS domain S-box-containing protein